MKKTSWQLEKLMRSLWYLFHDTYTRRTNYTEMTKSSLFPQKFCATRWVEDVSVAKRVIEMWPYVNIYVKETLKMASSAIPTCASFLTDAVRSDPLVLAKLEFFVFVAGMLSPFLTKYQVIIKFHYILYYHD